MSLPSPAFVPHFVWNHSVSSCGNSLSPLSVARRTAWPRRNLPTHPTYRQAPLTCSADKGDSTDGPPAPPQSYITVETACEMASHALSRVSGDVHELARTCAVGAAEAFSQCYPPDEYFSIFIVCGTGLNGLVALHLSAILKEQGYELCIYSPYASERVNVQEFCERHKIELYDFAPTTLDFYYDVLVDGLLGTGFDGGDIREEYWRIYEVLFSTELPVVSIDVPSGWDLTLGPREVDISADSFIKPDLLISLGAPKLCSKAFAGSYHYIAGRHVEHEWLMARNVKIPTFPAGSNCVLFSSNSYSYQKGTGEVYGRPGQFNATLYTRSPKRKWVDVDESLDLWDELD